jgi:hypothetical protein
MSPACPVFGFRVEITTHSKPLDDLERELVALADARGLIINRAHDGRSRTLVVRSEAGQATDLDRQAVLEWARKHTDAVETTVGLLEDVGTLA